MEEKQAAITMSGFQMALLPPSLPLRFSVAEPQGAVFTKPWVVELLLDLAGFSSDRNLVDAVAVEPSAGHGAFFSAMVERLLESCERMGRPVEDCRNSLIAYELDEESADRVRTLAIGLLMAHRIPHGLAKQLSESWVRLGDYLLESSEIEVDFVLGNPPYVRLEEIPEEIALHYRNIYPTMRGRADLYVAFFEAGLRQLKQGATCAFICADRWMRNQYGAALRALVTSCYAVDFVIEMHNANAFDDDVDAYPAITVVRKKVQGAGVVASAGPEAANSPPQTLSATLKSVARGEPLALPHGLRTAVVEKWFRGAEPWPCHSPEQLALLRKLEEHFPPIEAYASVGIGVATGNDAVFITNNQELIEPSRLLKLAISKDIHEGCLQWSGSYLVDPWDDHGLVVLDDYPRLRDYLEAHKVVLKRRHTAANNRRGWYKTIDRVNHALTGKPKLYIADIKNTLDPILDRGETYPHHNLYFIQSDHWNLEVLGGLLLSAIGQFFIESYGVRMRGGCLRFQAQYLRRIRVPDPSTLSKAQTEGLINAFRERDRKAATQIAVELYGIEKEVMETALGY
ncbi:MAG: Eco57I restriction-modification methylase domain-containing protein [Acidobacteriaceae bacterium]